MIHFLTNTGHVQENVISYLIPFTVIGKKNNYTKFCKQICDIVQLLSTCHVSHEYKINFLERCFRELDVGYCTSPVNYLTYKVKDIRHSFNMIKSRLQKKDGLHKYTRGYKVVVSTTYSLYGKELIAPGRYTKYGKELIAPPIFDYDKIKSRLKKNEMEFRKMYFAWK